MLSTPPSSSSPAKGLLASALRQPGLREGVLPLLSVALMFGLRWLLNPFLGSLFPYMFFLVAVIWTGWYCGFRPAVLAILVSAALGNFFFSEPQHAFSVNPISLAGLFFFVGTTLVLAWTFELSRRARAEAEKRWQEAAEAREQLRLTNERLQATLGSITDAYFAIDADVRITYVNTVAAALTGKTEAEVLGRDALEVFPFYADTLFETRIREAMARGTRIRFEAIGPVTGRWFETTVYPAANGVSIWARDIHERKMTEEMLRENEERLRLALSAGDVGTWDWDIAAGRVMWSERLYVFHGLKPGQFDGTAEGFAKVVHPDDRARVTHAIQATLERDAPYQIEMRVIRPNGETRWLSTNGRVVRDLAGKPIRMLGATVDITERKQTEAALQESDRRLRLIFQSDVMGMALADSHGRLCEANDEFLRLAGQDRASLANGRVFLDTFDPSWQRDGIGSTASESGPRAAPAEKEYHRQDGVRIPVLVGSTFLGGDPALVLLFALDLSERKAAERVRREFTERLQIAQQAAHCGTFEYDYTTNRNTWSPEIEALYGLKPGEFPGTIEAWRAMVHPDDALKADVGLELARQTGDFSMDFRIICKDTAVRWIFARARVFYDQAGQPQRLLGVNVDITDRKRAEEALALREADFRAMFELASVGAGQIDVKTRKLIAVNRRFCEITGYTEAELLDLAPQAVTHPEDRAADLAAVEPVFEGRAEQWRMEKRFLTKSGNVVWAIVMGRLIRDSAGRPQRTIAHVLDITERKQAEQALRQNQAELTQTQAELRRHAEQLEQTVAKRTVELQEKIGELEAFSYSVSHDLRSPLRALNGYAAALLEDYGDRFDEAATSYLRRITKAAERLDRLTQDILAYSRVSSGKITLAPVNLKYLIREIIEQYEALSPARTDIRVREPLADVLGHEPSLTQCLSNLLSNAVKFVRPGQRPDVELWTEPYRDRVRVWVRDHGIGIAPEHQGRIFGMFERIHAHNTYEGTGIGLAIVRKAVERMGGSVGVESELGRGSTFWLDLARA